ncbi:NADH-ubiquinone oxidoreductase chain C [hydrothermal vent metagenome]|uniref:NADH-ubiquinone oxidoreductase chain C n=1 Tax=hydrothermal vent metagenome TaxID=652676 RepID=A0A3B1C9P5_9ZZZZ
MASDSGATSILSAVKAGLSGGGSIIHSHSDKGDDTIVIKADDVLEVMRFLKEDEAIDFSMMMDLTVVDYLGNEDLQPYLRGLKTRFEVVYHLYSMGKNHRLRVKAPVTQENCEINSVTSIWLAANWFEREAWDLYGVKFRGHPDLRRILLYEEFEGHPLRKDFPKKGRQPLLGPRN